MGLYAQRARAAFDALTDADLERMTLSAWREAARCYQEARACTDVTIRPMLLAGASDATMYWVALRDETERRATE